MENRQNLERLLKQSLEVHWLHRSARQPYAPRTELAKAIDAISLEGIPSEILFSILGILRNDNYKSRPLEMFGRMARVSTHFTHLLSNATIWRTLFEGYVGGGDTRRVTTDVQVSHTPTDQLAFQTRRTYFNTLFDHFSDYLAACSSHPLHRKGWRTWKQLLEHYQRIEKSSSNENYAFNTTALAMNVGQTGMERVDFITSPDCPYVFAFKPFAREYLGKFYVISGIFGQGKTVVELADVPYRIIRGSHIVTHAAPSPTTPPYLDIIMTRRANWEENVFGQPNLISLLRIEGDLSRPASVRTTLIPALYDGTSDGLEIIHVKASRKYLWIFVRSPSADTSTPSHFIITALYDDEKKAYHSFLKRKSATLDKLLGAEFEENGLQSVLDSAHEGVIAVSNNDIYAFRHTTPSALWSTFVLRINPYDYTKELSIYDQFQRHVHHAQGPGVPYLSTINLRSTDRFLIEDMSVLVGGRLEHVIRVIAFDDILEWGERNTWSEWKSRMFSIAADRNTTKGLNIFIENQRLIAIQLTNTQPNSFVVLQSPPNSFPIVRLYMANLDDLLFEEHTYMLNSPTSPGMERVGPFTSWPIWMRNSQITTFLSATNTERRELLQTGATKFEKLALHGYFYHNGTVYFKSDSTLVVVASFAPHEWSQALDNEKEEHLLSSTLLLRMPDGDDK